jgi:hypothetical protein
MSLSHLWIRLAMPYGVIFIINLILDRDTLLLLLNHAFIILVTNAFAILLIVIQPALLLGLHTLFTLNWTIATLYSLISYTSTQTDRLQLIYSQCRCSWCHQQFHHITPILKSLYWLKIDQ